MDLIPLWTSLLLLFSSEVSSTNNSYVILTPSTFRPGMLVNMTVLILKEDRPGTPVNVNATFLIKNVPIASAAGEFRAGVLGFLQLSIPFSGFPKGSNRFNARKQLLVVGSGGLTFKRTETWNILFNNKGFSIYIQTDKGIYKPSQTVRMRILAVYPNLKVYTGKMTIQLTDPKNNKLAVWKDVMTASGVISKDFELSSQPNMGTWRISVTAEERKEAALFEVREYVLPKFKVDVLTNSYATLGNGDIRGVVSAKYTYGKGVKGLAKLWVYFGCYRFKSSCKTRVAQREFQIDGNHSFTIPEEEIDEIYRRRFKYAKSAFQSSNQVTVNVSVTEALTGKTFHGTTTVNLKRTDVVIKYLNANPKSFKPNVKFQILFQVTYPDKTPAVNTTVRVRVRNVVRPVNESYLWKSYTSDENGYIGFYLNVSSDISGIYIFAEAVGKNGEKDTAYQYLPKFKSQSNTFLQLRAEKYEVQAGENIVCNVSSTESITSFNYMVLSRGSAILSASVNFSREVTLATLRIRTSSLMSPSANIIVYFVRDDGEIVADSLKIRVSGAFENFVSVKFSSAVVKPGESVNVDVKASPFSQVGLLAVDKSVLLLKEGNDFSVEQVMRELESYGIRSSGYIPFYSRRSRRSFRYIPWYPSGTNARDIFKNSGVAVLTDSAQFLEPRRLPFLKYSRRRFQTIAPTRANVESLVNVEKVRSFFPETWLWENVETNSAGEAQVSTTSPDTITSWVLSGFAVSNVTGFGVANEKPQLRVFQPFFLSMDLPYSVIRGEEVALKVIVFNYENVDMKVYVTLKGSPDWKNINRSTNASDRIGESTSSDVISVINVPTNSGKTVSFPVIPTKLGNVPITVSAQSTTSADAVRRTLLVEPEGIEQDYSYSLLLDLNETSVFKQELELALPANVVKGSAKAMISVIGDIMGSSISGIENLLRMPYGCGEQNMINFAPSVFIRAYLENVDQLTPSIKEKSLRFMTLGYQRELTYQHRDGSYSAFGEKYRRRRPGSLWLTAFVLKSFARAKDYIYIDPVSLQKSVKFILSTQRKDGSFHEPGKVSSYLQGGLKSASPEALTAYVLVSLLEYGTNHDVVQKGTSRAIKFLKNNLRNISDSYTLALMAYALELNDDPEKETVLSRLMEKAIREDGTLHWTDASKKSERKRAWFRPYYRPRSADIEITAYALLVFAIRGEKQNGLPIARWLAQQRNSLGGYSSTQDTVIGLQALSEFAPLIFSPDLSFTVNIEMSSDPDFSKSFQVNRDNMVVLQRVELPSVKGRILVSANGTGIGMLQIGVTFNVDSAPTEKSFDLIVKVITADRSRLEAQSCVRYTGGELKSGMAILEFGLPSGFTVDQDDIKKLLSEEENKIQRIETPGRKAVLYFNEILKTEILCMNLTSVRTHAVGKAQPIPVVVYDYYKPEQRAATMYSPKEGVDLCDVCPDCTNCERRPVKDGGSCADRSDCTTDDPRVKGAGGTASRREITLTQFLIITVALTLDAYY